MLKSQLQVKHIYKEKKHIITLYIPCISNT
uniref:Uncharacterized protein n=1 Tax=Anguilla anguilla TaxID=7936 RepID=A0A0E9PMK2_ANGAN